MSDAPASQPRIAPKKLVVAIGSLVVLLAAAGAASFVHYARSHAPDSSLVVVAPFDIFVAGLESWRVGLAERLTARLNVPPLAAVPQTVVKETWRSAQRPEVAAVELARKTRAALAIYARVDPIVGVRDSVRVSLIGIDATTTRIAFGVLLRRSAGDPDGVAAELNDHIRHSHPLSRPAASGTPPSPPR